MTATPLPNPGRVLSSQRARTALVGGSLALIIASAVTIALAGAWPDSSLIRTAAHARPGWLSGPLSPLSLHVTRDQFLLLEAAMAIGYVGVLLAGTAAQARLVLGTIVFLHVVFLLAPPLLSSDVFNYLDYAHLGALHGVDPYFHGPVAAPHDAAYALARWKHAPTVYGPLFTIASYPLAHVSLNIAIWCFKLVAVGSSLGCVALVWRIAGKLGRSPVRAAAIYGLNPVLLVWTVGGAHNDLPMLLLALAGVALALESREALGGAAVVAGAAVKATAGLVLPFLLIGVRRGARAAVGAALAAAVVVGVTVIAFPGHPLSVLTAALRDQRLVAFDGIPKVVADVLGLPQVTPEIRTVAHVAFAVVAAGLCLAVRRGYDWVAACGWAMIALVLSSPWLLAWYTVWPLPFAAVSRDRRLLAATLTLELYFLVAHLPMVMW